MRTLGASAIFAVLRDSHMIIACASLSAMIALEVAAFWWLDRR